MIALDSSVSDLPFVGPAYEARLEKLEIETVWDLLIHVPNRYIDFRSTSPISKSQPGEILTIAGELTSIKNQYAKSGKKMQIAKVKDRSGEIDVVWFNQPYLVKVFREGEKISLSGKVDFFGRKKALISPEYEKSDALRKGVHTGRLLPIYPETAGLSSKWLRGRIYDAFTKTKEKIKEILPAKTLKENNLVGLTEAIESVHFPKALEEAQEGRERLSFDELLMHQMESLYRKRAWQKSKAVFQLEVDKKKVNEFIESLPFHLTPSQKKATEEILSDLEKEYPMNRLLEGDVGSGKTVVATIAAFVSFLNGHQSVLMAPTQILAQQHFNTLNEILTPFKVRCALITSETFKADPGKTDIFVGTHALIHRKVDVENVSLVIIDEQHRFGVEQRAHLVKRTGKGTKAPHVLTMTATPIPRTIALTIYGDLDLSTLDELPKGRKPITTWLVSPRKRDKAYDWIEKQIKKSKVQAFVICPLIEESEKETMKQVKAATQEFEKLKRQFPKLKIGILHGRQKAKEKNDWLTKFKEGKLDILVATPVVEVGIDITNATIMVVEGAERFGLAQLHQLRGRVGRGKKKSYCLLFTQTTSPKVNTRLSAMQKTVSGFELSELDLKIRGPGEIFGVKQHGFPELKIASWQDTQLIKRARKVAIDAVNKPKDYKNLISELNLSKIAPN